MAWSKAAIDYFGERAINPDVAAELGVRESGEALEFPYRNGTGEQYSRTRALTGAGPKVRQPAGTRLCPWQPVPNGEGRDMLVCEGESDLLAAVSALRRSPIGGLRGLPVVAIPGTGLPVERVVRHLVDEHCRQAWIALDADDAGRRYTERLIPLLVEAGIKPFGVMLAEGLDLAACLAAEAEDQRGEWVANLLCDAEATAEEETAAEEAAVGSAPANAEVREALDATHDFLSRFLVMSDDGLRVLALWTFHTWAFAAAETTPYISIRSPERESGKTRVIEVVSLITRSPEQAADASVSAVFRSIEKFRSTLLFDEVDTIFRTRNEDAADFRRILNSGYRVGGGALRTAGEHHEPKKFSTFSPKLLAGIGGLPDTLESRCVPIPMHRRLPHEQTERLRVRVVRPEAEQLADRLADGAARAVPILQGAFPKIPDELGDRAADCAEPLLAIADYAGDSWPILARKSLVALQGGRSIEDESTSTRLLVDIRTVFGERDRISSRDLLEGLHDLEEAPWSDWFGKPLSPAKLNRLLHDFSIHSRDVRFGTKALKGFHADQFEDAWARYVQPEPRQRDNPHCGAKHGESQGATNDPVSRHEISRNPAPQARCSGVAAENAKPPDQETLGAAWDRLKRERGEATS